MPDPLKNMLDHELLYKVASDIASVYSPFQADEFIKATMQMWDDLGLKDRIYKISVNLGKYLPEDYKQNWGHSIYTDGIALAEKSQCKHMIFCHFSQNYSDITLDGMVEKIKVKENKKEKDIKYLMAYDGMELDL